MRSLPVVCHRWCNILADASMWPVVDVTPCVGYNAWYTQQGTWLRSRAPGMQQLTLRVRARHYGGYTSAASARPTPRPIVQRAKPPSTSHTMPCSCGSGTRPLPTPRQCARHCVPWHRKQPSCRSCGLCWRLKDPSAPAPWYATA
jgi:hypothetical protein